MKRIAIALLSLPALLALGEAVTFYATNRNNGTIVSSGVARSYLLHVPKSYDRTKATPLVISMHGAGGWPKQQLDVSEWNQLADREGCIVVYPSGQTRGGPRVWRVAAGPAPNRDVLFISDLIDKLEADYNIDPRRIYANGLSNGGGMSAVLACASWNRIAAVGLVGAARTLPRNWCTDHHPVPMIDFHGTEDPMALYDGGTSWVVSEPLPNVPRWDASWAQRNRCDPRPVETSVTTDVTRREYVHCADDASVVLYTIHGGGHTWPGGGPLPEWFAGRTTHSIDATSEMWAFFQAHPLRRK